MSVEHKSESEQKKPADGKKDSTAVLKSILVENNNLLLSNLKKESTNTSSQLIEILTFLVSINSELSAIKSEISELRTVVEKNNSEKLENLINTRTDSIDANIAYVKVIVGAHMEALNGESSINIQPTAKGLTTDIKPKAEPKTRSRAVKKVDTKLIELDPQATEQLTAEQSSAEQVAAIKKPAIKKAVAKSSDSKKIEPVKKSNFLKLNIKDALFIEQILNSEFGGLLIMSFEAHSTSEIGELPIDEQVQLIVNYATENDSAALIKTLNANKQFKEFVDLKFNDWSTQQSVNSTKGNLEIDA